MSFFIDHPDQWIGVPEYWPFTTQQGAVLESPEQWALALVDDVTEAENLSPDARARAIELLLMAAQRGLSSGSRVFMTFEDWNGPAYVVESRTERRLGTQSLESIAGSDDPTQLGPVFVESFGSESGLAGVRCYRYLPYDDHGIIYGRVDYAFAVDDEVLTISGGELDLVYFERLKPEVEALAATVSWSEAP